MYNNRNQQKNTINKSLNKVEAFFIKNGKTLYRKKLLKLIRLLLSVFTINELYILINLILIKLPIGFRIYIETFKRKNSRILGKRTVESSVNTGLRYFIKIITSKSSKNFEKVFLSEILLLLSKNTLKKSDFLQFKDLQNKEASTSLSNMYRKVNQLY